jgi:hypothetical protein
MARGSPRVASTFSDQLQHRLNAYAMSASAAGVGLLVLALPSEAKVIYARVNHVIPPDGSYSIKVPGAEPILVKNLTGCGTYDSVKTCWGNLELPFPGVERQGVVGHANSGRYPNWVSKLPRGATVGTTHQSTQEYGAMMFVRRYVSRGLGSWTFGDWRNAKEGYLGLELIINGETHWGWARFNVKVDEYHITPTITGYAYQTIPNHPIVAGYEGNDDAAAPIPYGSLGHLALGRKQ